MLRGNLATRPFYNERVVGLLFGLAAVLVVAFTAYNVTQAIGLSRRNTELATRAAEDEARARDLERQATDVQRGLSGTELQGLADAAGEANALIEQRTFSWTELFNRIETTLPGDAMLTSVRPTIDEDGIRLSFVVVGRRVENIDQFMERLEASGAFSALLSRQEEVTEEGMYRAVIEGQYHPETVPPPGAATPPADGSSAPAAAAPPDPSAS